MILEGFILATTITTISAIGAPFMIKGNVLGIRALEMVVTLRI
jgi:hypothetical protein